MIQEMELSGAAGHCARALDNSSFGSCSSSLAHDTDEAMSTSSRKSPSMRKERDWWSVDLEGGMEKLEVVGHLSRTEGGSVDPKGKMGHWSTRTSTTQEESEEQKGAEH